MYKFKVKMWKNTNVSLLRGIREKYKERLNDYMSVYIYDSNEEMYEAVNKLEREENGKDYYGRTLCYTSIYRDEKGEIVKLGKKCGNIYFSLEDISSYVTTHEVSHAVIGYIDRRIEERKEIFNEYKEYQIVKENNIVLEELVCYMIGSLSNQINEYISKNIINKYYKVESNN